MLANPNFFMNKQEVLFKIIQKLSEEKKVILISNLSLQNTKAMAEASLGPEWEFLFNFVIVDAKKPLFMSAREPFIRVDSDLHNGK